MRIIKTGRMERLGCYCTQFQGEVNETTDWDACLSNDPGDGTAVLRGANITLYQVRDASQGQAVFISPERFFKGKQHGSKALFAREERVGFQRSAPQNNFRRLIAAIIAPNNFCVDTVSFIPKSKSKLPLAFVTGLLNSLLLDWYFRLGSTNSKVNEYQFNNLPCPTFRDKPTPAETATGQKVTEHLAADRPATALPLLKPLLETPPFSPVVRDAVVAAVDRIIDAEGKRGEMTRSDRSALSPAAATAPRLHRRAVLRNGRPDR